MKILMFSNNDMGLYKFRKELVEELLKKHNVYICVPDGIFINELVSMGCIFIPCTLLDRHGKNPIKDVRLYYFYRSIIKKYKPDIAFTYTIKPNVYGGMACACANVPYVANITGLGMTVENKGIMQKLLLLLYKLGLRKAQKVFFQNTTNQDFMLKRNIIKGSYDLLPGSGVNLSQYIVLDYPNGSDFNFLFVARIMPEKGIEQYLDAAEKIHEMYPNAYFHICGEFEPEYNQTRIKKLIIEGVVLYHGEVSDLIPMYKMSCCTIHPSFYAEGLSNVLLESCACGRPIITTDRPGCREVIDDGINGYIVRQRDSKDLIEKIQTFMSLSWEDRRRMGMNGRKKVEAKFDRKIIVEKYMKEIGNY